MDDQQPIYGWDQILLSFHHFSYNLQLVSRTKNNLQLHTRIKELVLIVLHTLWYIVAYIHLQYQESNWKYTSPKIQSQLGNSKSTSLWKDGWWVDRNYIFPLGFSSHAHIPSSILTVHQGLLVHFGIHLEIHP